MDYDKFTIEKGNLFEIEQVEECPEEFAKYVPDYESLGYRCKDGILLLKNGQAYGTHVWFGRNDGISFMWGIYKEETYLDADLPV